MQNSSKLQYFLGFLSRRIGSIGIINCENGDCVNELMLSSTMPKRVRPSSTQKSKKSRHSVNKSQSKRNSIPRSCKNAPVDRKGFVDFDFLSIANNRINMGSNQTKPNEKVKDKRKEKDDVSMSEEELDVVYDVQEEKKNKIYEVITVMSDDETPNQITYERIYAEDPEKRMVDESEIKEMLSKKQSVIKASLNDNDIVDEIVREANLIKEKTASTKKAENNTGIIKLDDRVMAINTDTKDDSDNEVICVAVLDPKSKAEQKRSSVEEICLSSDSESESLPKISPIRLKIPFSGYPYVSKYRYRPMNESENSYGSNNSNFDYNNSNFSLGFSRPVGIYPYVCGSKASLNLSDWESNSTHSKASSVDDFSPAASESPKVLVEDESSSSSSSSVLFRDSSQHQQNLSPRSGSSDNEIPSSPTASSDDEDSDIYWKANRDSRRKGGLRYEEFTDFGRKIHEGELDLDINTTFTFKVMSYNVLAQTLLEGHMYLYKDHDRRALSWARRWDLIFEEIKDENPEILCVQEVDTAHLTTHYAKLLDLGYRWVYKKRTGKNQDGVAVFYKAAMFDAEAHSQVEFYQPGVSVLDRDNVGVVLRLRLRNSPNHAVVVATTHLLYNPRRSDVRLAQIQLLLAEIDRLAYNKDALTYYPVILAGDFNLKPHSGVYKLLTEGQLCYEGTSRRNLHISSSDTHDSNILPRTLLPWRLGVTDRCQHVDVLEARVRGESTKTTRLYNSEHNRSPLRDVEDTDSKDDRFESGTLCHGFNFQSVYAHSHPDGQLEASTHHESWVTVDYIFYSTPKTKDKHKKEEGTLQLLSRMRLPTQDECERFLKHLPNFAFGSDHLPLVAKFLIRLQSHHESGDDKNHELRNEEFTSLGKKIHEGQIKIQPDTSLMVKVMTYNVLAQPQLEAHPLIYKDNDAEALQWENRWPLIYNKIKDEDPQILCLQEVEPLHTSSHFSKLFELGYNWVFKKTNGTHEDGVAVFYKADEFEDEAHSQIELNQHVEPLTADKAGIVVRLRLKHMPQHAIVVATAHLVYNPKRSDIRLAQAQVMLAEIDRLAYNKTLGTYYPVILTGDFNLQPHTGVYKYLTEGYLKYEGLSNQTLEPVHDKSSLSRELLPCRLGVTDKSQHVDVLEARVRGEDTTTTRLYHSEYNIKPYQQSSDCSKDSRFGSGTISHGFNFRSAYPHKQSENKLEASTNHNDQWITVDYIFYSTLKAKEPSQKVPLNEPLQKETPQKQPLELLSWERLPTQDECTSHIRHLPNSADGSDHLPLTATFLLHLD